MDRYDMAVRLLNWARAHPQEWSIVCGFERGSVIQSLRAAEMLRDEGFYELCLMMTVRTAQMRLGQKGGEE